MAVAATVKYRDLAKTSADQLNLQSRDVLVIAYHTVSASSVSRVPCSESHVKGGSISLSHL